MISFLGKDITLSGFNPDDPANVAATVLYDYDLVVSDVGPKSSIEGITFSFPARWCHYSAAAEAGPLECGVGRQPVTLTEDQRHAFVLGPCNHHDEFHRERS